MARIETYSPQASVNVPGVARLPGSPDVPRLGSAAAGAAAALGQKATGQADIAQAQGYAAGQLGRFGGDVSSAGADVMAYQQQQQQIADTAWLAKATAETKLSTHISEAKLFSGAGDASVGPTGYADAATGNIAAFGEAYAKNAPSARAKQAYQNWLVGEQADAKIRAYDHQQKKQEEQTQADFITALDAHTRLVSADPTQFDAAWASAEQDFAAAARWMNPAVLAAKREQTRHDMELTRAQTLQKSDPLGFQREVDPSKYIVDGAAAGIKAYDPATDGPRGPFNFAPPPDAANSPKGWADNPLYSHLQADEVAALLQGADKAVVDQHNAAVNAQNLAQAAKVDALKVAVHDGTKGPSEILQARKEGWLSDYNDIAAVDEVLKKQQEDGKTLALGVGRIAAGDHFNPVVEEDKKQIDAVAKSGIDLDALVGKPPMGPMAGQGGIDPQALARAKAFSLTATTGILAPSIADSIRGGIVDRDPQRMMAAYQLWNKLLKDPSTTAATTAAFTADDLKNYDHYTLVAPFLTGDKLVEEMSPVIDRQAKERRDLNRKAWDEQNQKDLNKGIDYMPDVLSALDPAGWGNKPAVPDDSDTARAVRDTYEEGARYAAGFTNDPVQIKEKAIEFVQREWGTTQAGSGSVIIRHPPERSFLPIRGSFDWMDQQIEGQVKSIYPGASDWAPVTLPETDGAKGVKVTPRWAIVVHENGVHHVIAPPDNGPPGWPFDYNAAYQAAQQETRDTYGSLMSVPPEVKDRAAKMLEMFIQRSGAYQDRLRARTDSSNSPFPDQPAPPAKHGPPPYGSVQLPPPLPQYPESAFSPGGSQ